MSSSVRVLLAAVLVVGGLGVSYWLWAEGAVKPIGGTLHEHVPAPSVDVATRPISVWVPPGYDTTRADGYPVLYMLDGERLFQTGETEGRWAVDETLSRLIGQEGLPPLIVVGVHSSERRLREYLPTVPFYLQPDSLRHPVQRRIGRPLADEYLQYLYEDVQAFVNRRYHTDRAASRTFIGGTGVGGLFSLYATAKLPFAFGGAAVFSPDWTPGRTATDTAFVTAFRDYLSGQWDALRSARLYVDHVAVPGERPFGPHRALFGTFLRARGFPPEQWTLRRIDGTGEQDATWAGRVEAAVRFLLEAPTTRPDPFFQPSAPRRK